LKNDLKEEGESKFIYNISSKTGFLIIQIYVHDIIFASINENIYSKCYKLI